MQIKDANIAVHNNLPSNLDVAGNHNLMYSVFRNLTENVLKYAGNGIQIVTTLENVEDTEYYHIVFMIPAVALTINILKRFLNALCVSTKEEVAVRAVQDWDYQ